VTAALLLNVVIECGLFKMGPDHDDTAVTTSALSSAFATRILASYAAHLQRIGIDLPSSRLHGPDITIEAL
jgi:hypothetical protein